MVGGSSDEAVERLRPATRDARLRRQIWAGGMSGRAGAGHFVKMVHNGIEYGLMQAYAEGFGILQPQGGVRARSASDRRRSGGTAAWSDPGCSI